MCHANTPQSLVPWGIYVSRKHSSIIGALVGIYVSRKHSHITGALGASMCSTQTLLNNLFPEASMCHPTVINHGGLGAFMCHTNTP